MVQLILKIGLILSMLAFFNYSVLGLPIKLVGFMVFCALLVLPIFWTMISRAVNSVAEANEKANDKE